MKKPLLWALLLTAIPCLISAQSAERTLLSAAGGSFSNASYNIGYSIGEPVIATYTSTGIDLLQGFQQPWYSGDDIPEHERLKLSFYPNPGREVFHLSFPISMTGDISVEVIDILGQTIWSHIGDPGSGEFYQLDLNLGHIATGTYMLRVTSGNKTGNLPFVKVSM